MSTLSSYINPKTTALELAARYPEAIKDRTFLITGVNPLGLGYATAEALASQSPRLLILTGRAPGKVQKCIDILTDKYPNVKYKALQVDLSSQESVRKAAEEVLGWGDVPAIDVVINNAGVMNLPERTLSVDGVEMHFATNHLGHFLLTNLLMPKILAAESTSSNGPRVINVASMATWLSPIRFSDINFSATISSLPESERPNLMAVRMGGVQFDESDEQSTIYLPFVPYGQSKTANILHTIALNAKLYAKHGVISVAVHPGEIPTELQRNTDPVWLEEVVKPRMAKTGLSWKSPAEGAATTLFAVCVAEVDLGLDRSRPETVKGGVLLSDSGKWAPVSAHATNEDVAERLWKVSEDLVGAKFDL